MLARGGTMLLAVLVVGTGLLAGAAQPAEAKSNNTAKVIAGFVAGFVLAEALSDDHPRGGHQPQRYQYTNRCDPRPTHYSYGYRGPGHTVRIEHRPVWRPQHYGHGGPPRHAYGNDHRQGYRGGHDDCRCGKRHVGYARCGR